MRIISLCVLTLLWGGFCGYAQQQSGISGFVYDQKNGEALIGVNIYLPELQLGCASNHSGYYVLPNLPAGSHRLVAEYLGYKPLILTIGLQAGEQKELKLKLQPELIEGATVQVVADSVRTSIRLYEKPISNIQLTARQLNAIPQVGESDLLRSLQTLPGIQAASDFSSELYVRGGTPDQNLYLIDGTDVYNPEHAFGIFSTFNTDAIKHVEISKGGFAASYGGRLSSILDVINLDGNREEFQGSASISLLSARTTLQMPLGEKGAVSGSIRRTYFDQTVARAINDLPDYYFYDGNLKAFWEINSKNKITLSGYGGRDVLSVTLNNASTRKAGFDLDWGNRTGSLRWTSVFTPKLFGNFWITGSRFSSTFDLTTIVPDVVRNFVSDLTFKGNLEYHPTRSWQVKFGFEQKKLHVIYDEDFPGGEVDIDQRAWHAVSYAQLIWQPGSRWEVNGGLRYNLFHSDQDFRHAEPRFSAKYRASETINLKLAAGRYYQYLNRISQTLASDIWSSANRYQNASSSDHLIGGVQFEIASRYELEIEAYHKRFRDIYQFNPLFRTELQNQSFNGNNEPVFSDTRGIFNGGDGTSDGAELLLRKDSGSITGWLGYAYSRTRFQFDAIAEGREIAPRHDRHSTVNLVANMDLRNAFRLLRGKSPLSGASNWIFGLNGVYSSGQPITIPGSAYISLVAPGNPYSEQLNYYPGAINDYRLPYYARVDVSLTHKHRFRNWEMDSYLQIFNVGNRKNVWFIDYSYSSGVPEVKTVNMFPFLPTLGVRFAF